ncbi:unnamed protein product [Schistosoma haematobium]|nr:unnamed protein product [Schistosoma haematobium]
MAQIYHALKSIILDFFGRVKPFDLAADTAALYHSSFFGSLKLWEDSIYFAVPKKRRTAEERRMRKFLSLRSGDYKPRDDLTPCKFCGYLNPRNFLCSKLCDEFLFFQCFENLIVFPTHIRPHSDLSCAPSFGEAAIVNFGEIAQKSQNFARPGEILKIPL